MKEGWRILLLRIYEGHFFIFEFLFLTKIWIECASKKSNVLNKNIKNI